MRIINTFISELLYMFRKIQKKGEYDILERVTVRSDGTIQPGAPPSRIEHASSDRPDGGGAVRTDQPKEISHVRSETQQIATESGDQYSGKVLDAPNPSKPEVVGSTVDTGSHAESPGQTSLVDSSQLTKSDPQTSDRGGQDQLQSVAAGESSGQPKGDSSDEPLPEASHRRDEGVEPPRGDAAPLRADPFAKAYPKNVTNQPELRLRIPNPMVGVEYRFEIPDKNGVVYGVWFLDAPNGEPIREHIGLRFQSDPPRIEGTPERDGDVIVRVVYGSDSDKDHRYADSRFYVNKNPRDMWVTREPENNNDIGWKPHRDTRELSASLHEGSTPWDLFGASIRGRAHAKEAKYREDDFALGRGVSESPWHIVVSCDGAGSAAMSRWGSALVAKSIVESLLEFLESTENEISSPQVPDIQNSHAPNEGRQETNDTNSTHLLREKLETTINSAENLDLQSPDQLQEQLCEIFLGAAHRAVTAISEVAEHQTRPVRDYSSTVLVAMFRRLPNSHKAFVATFQVGDGAIGIGIPGEKSIEWRLFGLPDSGQFAGETVFLSRSVLEDRNKVCERIRFDWFDSMPVILAMSDGVSDPRFPDGSSLEQSDGWASIWGDIEPTLPRTGADNEPDNWKNKLFSVLDRYDEGHHDDRTIVIARPTMVTKDSERRG